LPGKKLSGSGTGLRIPVGAGPDVRRPFPAERVRQPLEANLLVVRQVPFAGPRGAVVGIHSPSLPVGNCRSLRCCERCLLSRRPLVVCRLDQRLPPPRRQPVLGQGRLLVVNPDEPALGRLLHHHLVPCMRMRQEAGTIASGLGLLGSRPLDGCTNDRSSRSFSVAQSQFFQPGFIAQIKTGLQ